MENKKITLFKMMLIKEGKHWKLMKQLFSEMDDIGSKLISYPIIVVLVSFFHYLFSFAHFLFETVLFIFNKKQFQYNLNRFINKNYYENNKN